MCVFIIQYLKEKNIEQLLELDAKVYKKEHQISRESTLKRIRTNGMCDIAVFDRQQLVGYVSLCPVAKETFDRIRFQAFDENEIDQNVIPYNKPGHYYAYLESMVIDKRKYPKFKSSLLVKQLEIHLKQLQKKGIWFKQIIAFAVSKAGKRTLEKMGFVEVKENIYIFDCSKRDTYFFFPKQKFNVPFSLLTKSFNYFRQENQSEWDTDT